jgi:tetratricopeptide (TPR) repeat protein
VGAALALAGAATAHATPTEQLTEARERFREGNYEATIALLSPLLYPTRALANPSELTEAHLMLGIAYFEMGNPESAEQEFEEALFIDEALTLDPVLFSEKVVDFFDDKKRRLKKSLDDAAEKRRLAIEVEAYRNAIANSRQVVIEHRAYYVNFIPFGAGQFQNGQRGWGTFFFVSQALLGGTSLAMYAAQVIEWGFPLRVPVADRDSAQTLQVIQVGTGGLFLVVAAWGVIDALADYQPTVTVTKKIDPKLLPPPFLPGGPTPLPAAPSAADARSFSILPWAGPDRAGIAFSWEL